MHSIRPPLALTTTLACLFACGSASDGTMPVGAPSASCPGCPADAGATPPPGGDASLLDAASDGGPPFVGPNPCPGAEHFVAPAGGPAGDGSIGSPWDLATALDAPASVKPGDTIWLRGGTYGSGGSTAFASRLRGTATSPICVRQRAHERATVNGGLVVYGSYVWYWGFELEDTGWQRIGGAGGQDAIAFGDTTGAAVGNKIINMVIHDFVDGIADQNASTASESYGNVIYNVGYSAADRGHGHFLYLQNATSDVKIARENIGYNAFDAGIQEYGEASPVSHIHIEGNVAFDSGLPYGHRTNNVVISGGSVPKQDIVVAEQIAYDPLDAAPDEAGYNVLGSSGSDDLTVTGSFWIGATPTSYETLLLQGWKSVTFTGNTVVGPIVVTDVAAASWSGNTYHRSTPPAGDTSAHVEAQNPTGAKVFVRPNFYERGRANIVVLGWDRQPTVSVDVSGLGLAAGTPFEVRDVQSFFGTPVLTGTYTGAPLTLPMNLTEVTPIDGFATTPPHTSPEFGAFVFVPTP